MSLELFKKLVALANNNPNEHEANLAARKACKLIGENGFKFLTAQESSKPTGEKHPGQYKSYTNPSNMDYKDIYEQYMRYAGYNPFTSRAKEERWYDVNYYGNNDKRTIVCSECKEKKETRFRGEPSMWVCMDCRGKEGFKDI